MPMTAQEREEERVRMRDDSLYEPGEDFWKDYFAPLDQGQTEPAVA